MPSAQREHLAREREALAWELRTKGYTERQIIGQLEDAGLGKITQQAVSKMLNRVSSRMLKDLNHKVAHQKMQQTAALMKVYQEAMAAWERSKEPDKSITRRIDTAPDGTQTATPLTMRVDDSDGDPRFLDQARGALEDIRKIWGLNSAQAVAVGGVPGAPLEAKVTHDIAADLAPYTAALATFAAFSLGDGNGHVPPNGAAQPVDTP